jgi:hypothetical protein
MAIMLWLLRRLPPPSAAPRVAGLGEEAAA